MRENKGKVSLILLIIVVLLMGVIAYEVIIVDIFGILHNDDPVINIGGITNNIKTVIEFAKEENEENVEIVEPIINNNMASSENMSTSSYYYNQLDNYGKVIYNGFKDNIEKMKSGTYAIDFGTQFNNLLNSEGGEEKLNIAFQSAWNAFTYDNMDIFYIDVESLTLITKTTTVGSKSTHSVELSNGDNTDYLKSGFNSNVIKSRLNVLEAMREEIKRQVEKYDDFEKVRQVHNWLINNVEYDKDLSADEPYSIIGAMIEGEAVCEGYARSFKYIMDEIGIPCVLVSGTGTNSNGETESHAWNYVELDGKWYAIDVTWDDPIIVGNGYVRDEIRYENFLRGSNKFFKSHKEDGYLSSNSIKFEFPKIEKEDCPGVEYYG